MNKVSISILNLTYGFALFTDAARRATAAWRSFGASIRDADLRRKRRRLRQRFGKTAGHYASTVAMVATLAGCATQPSAPADPVRAQCEYEAEVAIQNIANPLYAGFRKGELIGMCMRAKGR